MQEQAAEPITSKPVEISEGREGFTSRASYLKYRSKTPFWKLVNATLASRALSHHVGWEAQYAVVIDDIPPVDRDIDLWQEVAISESFREGEILSFRVYFHHYLGGAHPNHNVDSINFFGGEGGLVTIRDLLHYDDEAAKALVDLCYDRIMAVHEVDEEGTLTTREEMRAEAWQRLERFTFDRNALTFAFPPYEVLAYAYGIPECIVGWDEIEDKIAERFKPIVARIRGIR